MYLTKIFLLFVLMKLGDCYDFTNGFCITSTNCGSTQYCSRDLPNPIGKCKDGYKDGESCLRNKYCESKRCSFFKCVSRDKSKDGMCDKKWKNTDCLASQYCNEVSDGVYKCVDRKCIGICRKNSQCLSDKCHLFTCVKSQDCNNE